MLMSFKIIETKYGKIYININDRYQYPALQNSVIPHIDSEIQSILKILKTLNEDIVFVDAGANAGLITIPIANYISGQVYSYEPQKTMFEYLLHSINLNNLKNVNAFNLGLGNKNEYMKVPSIDYNRRRDFGNVVLKPVTGKGDLVEIVKLDNEISKVDFLKVDVERMEYNVLLGAENLINTYRPWCWVEYIRSDLNQLVKFFKDKEYKVYYAEKRSPNIVASPAGETFDWFGDEL